MQLHKEDSTLIFKYYGLSENKNNYYHNNNQNENNSNINNYINNNNNNNYNKENNDNKENKDNKISKEYYFTIEDIKKSKYKMNKKLKKIKQI